MNYIVKNWKSKIIELIIFIIPLIIMFMLSNMHSSNIYETQNILSEENRELNSKNEILLESFNSLPGDFIKNIYKELEFTNKERISIYLFDDQNFKIIGRHSEHTEYKEKGREYYPKDEGFISKAWVNNNGKNYYYIDRLPEPIIRGKHNKKYTDKVCESVKIDKNYIKNMSMKSRCYYIQTITKDGKFESAKGVLVIETIDENFGKDKNAEYIHSVLGRNTIMPNLYSLIEINERTVEGE